MTAEGVYIPKEQDSKGINQFCPILLLNVEGKIFFSVIASSLTKYLTENGYINTSVQKGGIPGVSGCLEHATMICEAIQRAKSEKLNLDVIWLDLANAYGSVPHEMIQLALRMYHVPEVIPAMLDDYFSGFHMRFSTNNYTTSWIDLEVGIAMGCTISPILLVMAMEVILKAAEGSAVPPI
ncbi:reverse transcriptase [Plakobranchus ocellatus]|uniref:Reverse transcriptase n=1 Tax=Plakobranchus ocellatus TaxID=259542 RepID=A0AAV4A872_9GAST|nr:reverse transcriptase [Plakobranchus ocellatus]